jgi:hypothetical protein
MRIFLLVEPHDLLSTREHARLPRRGTRDLDERADVALDTRELITKRPAGRVVTDRSHQRAGGSGGSDVLRDVGRTTERVLALANAHHRHRRFGRDALDVAAEIHVEHGVAHDRHSATTRGIEHGIETAARDQRGTWWR